jgi:hypothetical protein
MWTVWFRETRHSWQYNPTQTLTRWINESIDTHSEYVQHYFPTKQHLHHISMLRLYLNCLLVCVCAEKSTLTIKSQQAMHKRDGAVVEALRYKPEGRVIDSGLCHWSFSLTSSFRPHYGPADESASNRNKYKKYFLG